MALGLHSLIFQINELPKSKHFAEEKEPAPIEIEQYDEKKQVVQTSRPKVQEDSDEPAEFYGEERNRVKKQTQSERKGRFQQGGRIVSPSPAPGVGDGEIPSSETQMSDLLAYSMSPNRMPEGVEAGPQTLLNTDSVVYASFINRVADEIYDPWVAFVNEAVDLMTLQGKSLAANVYITKLTVVVNKEGSVVSITTLASSGVAELDEATKKAFWKAEPFPNPPQQMFGSDNLNRFVYEFHFELKKSGFNIVPLI